MFSNITILVKIIQILDSDLKNDISSLFWQYAMNDFNVN